MALDSVTHTIGHVVGRTEDNAALLQLGAAHCPLKDQAGEDLLEHTATLAELIDHDDLLLAIADLDQVGQALHQLTLGHVGDHHRQVALIQ